MFVVRYLIASIVVIFSIRNAASQAECRFLPNQTTLEDLMSNTFRVGENPTPPNITLLELNYVCLASGTIRNTLTGVSFVARYECVGRCPGGTASTPEEFLSQFDLACGPTDDTWTDSVRGTRGFSRRDVADATLTSPNRTDCGFCFSPDHPQAASPVVIPRYDSIAHCVSCDAACNQGDMRCFSFGSEDCCNFYDRNDNRCLNECPEDTLPSDNFVCEGFLAFSRSVYVFSEEQGIGTIQISGTAGVVARVVGGPNRNMADVRISGNDINVTVTAPDTIDFNITDDDVAVEVDERYPVTIIPNDPSVVIRERMATIVIVDDVDRLQMGFMFANNIRVEGNMTAVPVRISGESIRDVFFDYLQEGEPRVPLTAMAGDYSEVDFIRAPVVNPDDEIALQDDRVFQLGLRVDPAFVDDVELGAIIGFDETFVLANLTIQDDDVVTVSFDPESYTVSESGNVAVTLSLDRGIAAPFTVIVEPVQLETPPVGLQPSIPTAMYSVLFPVSALPQSQSFTLTPVDDSIPSEPDEVIGLTFSLISDGRVQRGSDALVTIIDDDDLGEIGFSVPSYTFVENVGMGVVIVNGPADFPPTLSVQLVGGPGRQPGSVITSGSRIDQSLTAFPARVEFPITDDDAALEPVERYSLTLVRSDPSIILNQATAEINIIDDDVMIVGFPYEAITFPASAVGNATVNIFGNAQQPFTFNYIQELGGITPQQFAAGNFPAGFAIELPLTFPRNPDGPQNYFFMIGLAAVTDGVEVGGVIDDPDDLLDPLTVFAIANISIVDDTVVVGFEEPEYTFSESAPAAVIVIRNMVSDTTLTLEVSADTLPDPLVASSAIPSFLAGTFDFGAGFETSYQLDIQNDNIALENNEISFLSLGSPNNGRVMVGGVVDGVEYFSTTRLTITDDELVVIRIEGESTRSVAEGDSIDICVSKNIQSIRDVNFALTPVPRTAGVQDFSPTTVQSGSLLGEDVSFPVCFTFTASVDNIEDDSETFLITLQATDDDERISEQNSQVTITIIDTTPPTPTPTPTPPGDDVEDTVIGDPLFTVPLPNSQHLCYEIRGQVDQYFNFISDSCVSVNAHYVERSVSERTRPLHVIDEIAIRAIDNSGECVNILADRNGCTASVDGFVTSSYSSAGVSMRIVDNTIVVNVPNCNDTDLEMEVICETMSGVDMIRFEVTRGINLRETSHGLLGQFWNVAISVGEFTGDLRGGRIIDNIVLVTLTPSQSSPRTFPAWLEQKTWDNRKTCLYAGNQNGGTVYEVVDGHDALIEGVYKDYITDSAFSTAFRFSQFDNNRCN